MLVEFSKRMKEFFAQGIDWVMASGRKAQGINAFTITSGGTPDAVVFANLDPPLPDMATADYVVLVNGETAADKVSVDESSKATTGFTILNGGNTEVLNVVVIGRLEGMPAE